MRNGLDDRGFALFTNFIRLKKDEVKVREQIRFSLRCRNCNIFPPHLNKFVSIFDSVNIRSVRNRKILNAESEKLQTKVFKLELKELHFQLDKIVSDTHRIAQEIFHIDNELFTTFEIFYNNKLFFHRNNLRKKLDQKLEFNLTKNFKSRLHEHNEHVDSFTAHLGHHQDVEMNKFKSNIENLTNTPIPSEVASILSLGDKYNQAIRPTRTDILDILKNIENTINPYNPNIYFDIDAQERNVIRNKILKFAYHYNPDKTPITEQERVIEMNKKLTSKFISDNPDILITKSDKGNKTVLIYKDDYVNRMKDNLRDTRYYEKVHRNPLPTITKSIKNFIQKVNPSQTDSRSRKEKMRNNKINIDVDNKNVARAYGLVKTHKENFPLRIIVSAIGSPLHELSKLLKTAITRGCQKPKSHVKDSWSFKQKNKDIIIPQGWIFVKLDVESMFTNISLELILKAIDKRWNDIENHTPLNQQEFMEAITLVFENAYIQFDNEFYRQILGASMGLPLSPIVCDLVLEDAEVECLRSIHDKYKWEPIIFNRFVDDIFAIIPENQIDNFSNNKFNRFIRLGKDRIDHKEKTHVVYQLNCLECPKSYIGQTKQFLKKRISQHRNNINNRSQQPNVLTLHRLEDGHEFDWENPRILDTEQHYNKRLISEMFRIQLERDSLNIREDTKKLNSLYKNFFIDFQKQMKFKG
ncbi:hypothetical protein QAD02_016492 [Eretmocerus hayati]|uniref:Uncharacterized protein n=1 Tax=Eretmocerus hayati TaxID=131215 RepID=A0ACC2PBB0_9HYME|nr:hypothetical protein QAD02_016492 [Eretmocerus hayati]